jgi:hypothetical protein
MSNEAFTSSSGEKIGWKIYESSVFTLQWRVSNFALSRIIPYKLWSRDIKKVPQLNYPGIYILNFPLHFDFSFLNRS